jgi:hypothetical protein
MIEEKGVETMRRMMGWAECQAEGARLFKCAWLQRVA